MAANSTAFPSQSFTVRERSRTMFSMANVLSAAERIAVVSALVEGMSLRSVSRLTGVARNTVAKLLVDLGRACGDFQGDRLRGLTCKRVQTDELWSFIGSKQRNVPQDKRGEYGDAWTWVALDSDTKLCVTFLVGPRNAGACHEFMQDLAERVVGTFQLTTDGLNLYPSAVEFALGGRVSYAQLVKQYANQPEREGERRYSPAVCLGAERVIVSGTPDPKHVSTSHVERQNLTLRMSSRRYTRLTNAFSKKLENHWAAISLHFAYYNWCRIHGSLRITPAMAAGLARAPWSVADLVRLLDSKA
jgi:IS1 family transposase